MGKSENHINRPKCTKNANRKKLAHHFNSLNNLILFSVKISSPHFIYLSVFYDFRLCFVLMWNSQLVS